MDYLSHNIGTNLHRIRKSKGMSLDFVAEQTGVSKSMLAQMEKGNANPSIGVLGKIVSGLRINFDDLLSTPLQDSYLVDVDALTPTKEVAGKYRVWTCFPIADNHMVEIYRIEIAPGQEYVSGGHGERTREYVSVMEGRMKIKTAEWERELGSKEVLRFETDQDHTYSNPGRQTAVGMVTFVAY